MGALGKYVEIYRVQLKNNWVREAVYRTNFLSTLAVDIVWIAVEFSLFAVIYANTQTLAGWSRDQVYFFLGVFFASDALFTVFFQRNFWTFSDLVNRGDLDTILTRPVSPLFLALSRTISLSSMLNFFMGLAIIVRYSGPANFRGGWHWLQVPLWLCLGVGAATVLRFV